MASKKRKITDSNVNSRPNPCSKAQKLLCVDHIYENSELLDSLRDEAITYCATRGLTLGYSETPGKDEKKFSVYHLFVHAPVTLLPTQLPKEAWDFLHTVGGHLGRLIDKVSRDYQFLAHHLGGIEKLDNYIGQLMNVLHTINREGCPETLNLGIHRSDYFFESDYVGHLIPRQVELNTIAAGMGPLCAQVNDLQRFLIKRYLSSTYSIDVNAIPENPGLTLLIEAMGTAIKLHPYRGEDEKIVIFVVQKPEKNITDHKNIEYALWQSYGIKCVRLTLTEIATQASINKETNDLIIGKQVVVLLYFRAGYQPADFPSSKEWNALLMLERSRSIKCPSVAYHLAGTKKVQQVLALPGMLERFLSEDAAALVRRCYGTMWGLESNCEETRKGIATAISCPTDFVLKPQREGGGNNLWGSAISEKLKGASLEERSGFVLMKRIKPLVQKTIGVRKGELVVFNGVTEYGIFTYYIGDGKREFYNKVGGHLLRTKEEGTLEGGVSSGHAFVDTPILIPSSSSSSSSSSLASTSSSTSSES